MIRRIKADGTAEKQFLQNLAQRSSEADENIVKSVQKIISDVKQLGDEGVIKYLKKFDRVNTIQKLSAEQIRQAYDNTPTELISALKNAAANIRDFHERQVRRGYAVTEKKGIVLGYRVIPLDSVGIYVPGGTAAYPSTVLMNAIPASIAGVGRIVMVTPPSDKEGLQNILAAAHICGIQEVYLAGGAQALAGLAYGTKTLPKVDKLVGPGNIYVATAKKLLFGVADIDMVAGPSEILIIAQKGADPDFIAADMLSQAEHDALSSAILITDSSSLADEVETRLLSQLDSLQRGEIAMQSLKNFGAAIVVDDIERAAEISNAIAPEHLELMTDNPFEYLSLIKHAGSVFLGGYSPEPLGDYYAGPNHVLPTSGTARFFSSLGVDSFVKKSAFTYYSKEALKDSVRDISLICDAEGLTAHKRAVQIRFEDKK